MPLLKRKAFEKSAASGYLRDDDEVFHCEITDEIFKDYEEYCERIILVNSMVWSCEMTGKNNLTYAEALQSEKAARNQLKDFPMELRIPILFLAERTKRCSFAEMSEDIFNYVRDRYFVGETVEVCLTGETYKESHILSVTSQKQHPDNKSTMLPAASYCYEVEQFDESDPTATGEIGTAPFDRVRRRKGVYTRDKNRLFLKQFVEMGPNMLLRIKQSALDKYNISKVNFSQIFTGNPPEFASSKKLLKNGISPAKKAPGSASKLNKSAKKPSPDKKGRQESMDKFVKKTDKADAASKPKPPADPAAKKSAQELAEKMRRAEDQMRQRKEEEKAKKKEKNARLQAYLKEWQRVKDDLELEDHKVLPRGIPINMEGIPQEHIGDFFSVLEFIHSFSEILKAKDVFHPKLDVEMFRKGLTMKEHAGILCDMVQMFLTTIFQLQEDEADEYNENKNIVQYTEDKDTETVDTNKGIELATKASKWSHTYLGTPLGKLPIDPYTVTEVLRLHLLSSGAVGGARSVQWRAQARGGYACADDAGLQLRTRHPRTVAQLARRHVADLPLADKLRILQCLMSQVLSYAAVRDVLEERLDEHRNKKYALRTLQINERKREAQVLASKQELKKEAFSKKESQKLTGEKAKAVDEELRVAIDKLNADSEQKKKEYESKVKEMQAELFEYVSYLGSDRAYRRYWVVRAAGGVALEAGGEPRGACRDKPVTPAPRAADTLAYVTDLFENQREKASSDKENDSAANSRGNSPKKPLSSLNGLGLKVNGLESNAQQMRELMMCSGDVATCYVHGNEARPAWEMVPAEALGALAAGLNPRGLREHELLAALRPDAAALERLARACPLHHLNPLLADPPSAPSHRLGARKQPQPSITVPADCSLAEALELALRDHILELEEKIFHGCLGSLKVKDREAWRGTLMLRGYDKQAERLTWGPAQRFNDANNLPGNHTLHPQDPDSEEVVSEYTYRDPGLYLEPAEAETGAEAERRRVEAELVRTLASALLQVSQAIHHKYIKRPLGLDEKERKEREARNRPLELEALARWEVSLMSCRSVAGVALHLRPLDQSVAWSASILHASCRLCRRRADPDNMLLCDGCNKGHHLYCLKPKLTSVPEGDWFCDHCRPKEPTPRKRRKLYTDEDADDTLNSSTESLSLSGVCSACGSGGRLAAACSCGRRYHAECRRTTRHGCSGCNGNTRDSEDSEYNTALVKLKGRKLRGSKEASPLQNGTTKRTRKSKDEHNTSTKRKSKNTSLTNGVHEERSSRRRARAEVVFHADQLETLLRDVMRHKDSWPFYEPVSLDDVPDYLEVIAQPMDLGSIKSKLERGEYRADRQLLEDAALVFKNCYTYNKEVHPVARAGYRLEKYFNKRCTELELPSLPRTDPEPEDVHKKRSGPADDEEAPKPKKAKLK